MARRQRSAALKLLVAGLALGLVACGREPPASPVESPPVPASSPAAVPDWAKVSQAQVAEAARLKIPVALEEPTTGLRFVLIPEGTFQMGSPDAETGRGSDEGPVHAVRLSAYYLSVTEVTNAQFERFVTATGHSTTAEEEGKGHQLNPEKGWEASAAAPRLFAGSGRRSCRAETFGPAWPTMGPKATG